ncbi:MAG TPA: LysR family transcriptional regulator [Treponemataceae bacterium]|nr:LysR family transcriptional regulator [Treponemataceae bacterium]HPS44613.1 LysR family transcriptional regulator [Treponemataceae bacterium]
MTDFRLRTFIQVCRERSLTRAAERLHITQPAVTQHIKFLEEDLGHALLEIRGRNVTPTKEGELLLRYAETVESDAARTRERIAALGLCRSLRFGATRTIGEFVMPDYLAAWARDYPGAPIAMTVDNSDVLFRALHSGELDFIFVEGPFDRDSYSADLLFRDRMVAVASPRHRLSGSSVGIAGLLGETLIVRERGSGSRQLIEQALASGNRTLGSFARVVEIGNIGAIKRLVAAGTGIALLYGRSVARELSAGELSAIEVTDFGVSHEYSFVCLQRSLYESEYRLFLEHCRCLDARASQAEPREGQ